jgi:DUF4097 and DUF4098 domain-containing protein YvlB
VEIVNTAGSVVVTGWDRDEIRITGTLGAGTEELAVEGGRERTRIRVVLPRNGRNVKGSDLEIRVPAGKDVTVRTVSADVGIRGIEGAAAAQTTSGDVEIEGRPREVRASSTSGDVEVEVPATGRVRVSSTSGDVRVGGSVRENVSAESVSGDVVVRAATPEVRAKAVSGDLLLSGVDGRVSASTVSGDAEIRDSRIQYGSFETVSGNLRLQGELVRGAALDLQSHSGDVELILPADLSSEVEAKTFSGEILSDFGGEVRRTSRYTPGRELRLTAGRGGGLISVQTFSGTVKLLRR